MACIFCDIAFGKKKDYVVWENERFTAFLDRNPAKEGHLSLIPKEHIDYFFDMHENLYNEMFRAARQLSEPLKKATGAKRIGIAVVGFDVPHVHLHLIPLHGSNELLDPAKFRKASDDELEKVQGKLREAFYNE